MNRSRTYNPTISRRVLPVPPAQAYMPAGGTQRYGSNQKPIANGQRPIAKIQRPTPNPQFSTPRWTHTFSAKEKDSETGLSYFGSRYYSSDLSIWLSVDPMSDKYPSLSPYVYCADNPVKLVDPEGEDIVPSNKFINSTYFIVFQKMTKNNVYKQLSSRFSNNDNKLNFHLDYNTNPFTSNAGRDGINKSILIRENGIIISGDIFSEYGRPNGIEFSEIAKVQVLLHEIIHANNKLDNIQTPNHDGFDREKVLLGLIEYNETNNLGYSNDDLEILSWCGLTKSNEFKEYINSQSRKNGNSEEKEIQAFNIRLNLLLINKAPEARQED